jgi:hypothetical protein
MDHRDVLTGHRAFLRDHKDDSTGRVEALTNLVYWMCHKEDLKDLQDVLTGLQGCLMVHQDHVMDLHFVKTGHCLTTDDEDLVARKALIPVRHPMIVCERAEII